MNIQRLTTVLFGLILSTGLIAPSVATQGLMCNVDEPSNVSNASKSDKAPESITNQQLAQISNILLAITFFGMPTALLLAVLRHDKQDAQRTQFIEQLERIWKSS